MKFYKVIIAIFLILVAFGIAVLFYYLQPSPDDKLSPQEIHDKVIHLREKGIALAKANGDYKCCIEPACTMCYDSANKWNYGQAGKCFCDEFIAKGEEPCPQCQKGIDCLSQDDTTCEL